MTVADIILELDSKYNILSLDYEEKALEFFKTSFNLYIGMNIPVLDKACKLSIKGDFN